MVSVRTTSYCTFVSFRGLLEDTSFHAACTRVFAEPIPFFQQYSDKGPTKRLHSPATSDTSCSVHLLSPKGSLLSLAATLAPFEEDQLSPGPEITSTTADTQADTGADTQAGSQADTRAETQASAKSSVSHPRVADTQASAKSSVSISRVGVSPATAIYSAVHRIVAQYRII